MAESWTCDACSWTNSGGALCERCGQALHWQLDPPADLPRQPAAANLPEFWSTLLWSLLAAGTMVLLLPGPREAVGLAPGWLLLQLVITGGAALASLRGLVFRLMFHQLELDTPPHARSGTMLKTTVRLAPYSTLSRVHIDLDLRELRFDSNGTLRQRRYASVQLNTGSDLRGRRVHVFAWDFPAPTPAGRYMNLQNEMSLSFIRAVGRFLPWVGLAASQLREDGGWFVRLRVRRGLFVKTVEKRVTMYDPRAGFLVG